MEYISTRNTQKTFSFKDVFLKGLAPDGGLFVPKKIPLYTSQELERLRNLSYNDLATKIILKFCSDEFNETEVKDLVDSSYKNFRVNDVVTIKKLEKINLLELFHGPTLAFKDIAMQVIGNMYEIILKKNNSNIIKAWELNERHYGGLTGLNKDGAKKKLGKEQVKKFRRSWDISPPPMKDNDENNTKNDLIYNKIALDKIPVTESLKDTYNRVIPYFEKEIKQHIKKNKNVLISAHGNSLRALCKKILKISDEKIVELEIPTGNPLIINFSENLEVTEYKYLDKERGANIIFNK